MRRFLTTGAALALLGGVAVAQVPIPAFARTFTSATLTRGLLFQAPGDFRIVAVQVPDESAFGTQHFAVYNMATQPPMYSSATAPITPSDYQTGPAANLIPTNVLCKQGEWIGVLGACGDTTTMRNSYGASGPFASNIAGQAISITRFITQTNIASNSGVAALSESTGSIGRVDVYVAGLGADTVAPAPGSTINYTLQAQLDGGFPYQLALALSSGAIPIDSRVVQLALDPLFLLSVQGLLPGLSGAVGQLDTTGQASASLAIPNIPQLTGVKVHSAFITLNPSAPSGVATISEPHIATIT